MQASSLTTEKKIWTILVDLKCFVSSNREKKLSMYSFYTGVKGMSVIAVLDIPKWITLTQLKSSFAMIKDYSSVPYVFIDVLLDLKKINTQIFHTLIHKCRNHPYIKFNNNMLRPQM